MDSGSPSPSPKFQLSPSPSSRRTEQRAAGPGADQAHRSPCNRSSRNSTARSSSPPALTQSGPEDSDWSRGGDHRRRGGAGSSPTCSESEASSGTINQGQRRRCAEDGKDTLVSEAANGTASEQVWQGQGIEMKRNPEKVNYEDMEPWHQLFRETSLQRPAGHQVEGIDTAHSDRVGKCSSGNSATSSEYFQAGSKRDRLWEQGERSAAFALFGNVRRGRPVPISTPSPGQTV